MHFEYSEIQIGERKVRYLELGQGETLLFLHGFLMEPHVYLPLLQELAKKFHVIAPSLYGKIYLADQPQSIVAYAELISAFITVKKLDSFYLCGHSLGGALSLILSSKLPACKSVVVLNPVLDNHRTVTTFTLIAVWKWLLELGGIAGWASVKFAALTCLRLVRTLVYGAWNFRPLIRDIATFEIAAYASPKASLLVYGEREEFFDLTAKLQARFQQVRPQLVIQKIAKYNHDWPLFYPKAGARAVVEFFLRSRGTV